MVEITLRKQITTWVEETWVVDIEDEESAKKMFLDHLDEGHGEITETNEIWLTDSKYSEDIEFVKAVDHPTLEAICNESYFYTN